MTPHKLIGIIIIVAIIALTFLLTGCQPFPDKPGHLGADPEQIAAQPAGPTLELAKQHRPTMPTLTHATPPAPTIDCPVPVPPEYAELVHAAAVKAFGWGDIREGYCWSLGTGKAESQWQLHAVSSAGAQCLFQLLPGTASDLGVRNVFDPAECISAGVRYLSWCSRQWTRSTTPRPRTLREALRLGSGCYNWGTGNLLIVQRREGCRYWQDCFDMYAPEETRVYVARIEHLVETGEWWSPS